MNIAEVGISFFAGCLITYIVLRNLVIKPLAITNEILEGFISGLMDDEIKELREMSRPKRESEKE